MERKEFVEAYRSALKRGREARYPDISPAEEAKVSADDKNRALFMWHQNRAVLSALPVQDFLDHHAKIKTIYDLKES
jgi:hypothetical protein